MKIIIQGIVTGTGDHTQFGEVFKLMKAEEVSLLSSVTLQMSLRNVHNSHAMFVNFIHCIHVNSIRGKFLIQIFLHDMFHLILPV